MADKLHRNADDLDLGRTQPLPGGSPGKSTLTSRLFRRPIINVYRSAERVEHGVAAGAEEHVERAAGASGSALPADLRERFEASLGADLSGVRVHTGADSETAASAVGARAYTVGNDIHFGAGQFAPSSTDGLLLIAHEVAHTVQQAGAAPTRQHKLEVSSTGDAAEVEADRAASAMVSGGAYSIAGAAAPSVQRKAGDTEVSVTGDKNELTAKWGADGTREGGYSRVLFNKSHAASLCPKPPLYANIGIGAKVSGSLGNNEEAPATAADVKGSIAIEVEGSIGCGVVADSQTRTGIEGGLKGSAKFESGVTITGTGGVPDVKVLPFEAPVEVDAWVGLVGETDKAGASLKRTLSSIALGKIAWDGQQPKFTYTATAEDWEKAGQDLVRESQRLAKDVAIGTTVPGALYQQHAKDKAAKEQFDADTDKLTNEPIGGTEQSYTLKPTIRADSSEAPLSPARQREAIEKHHPQFKAQMAAAKAEAVAAKGKCNSLARDGKEVKPEAQKLYSGGFQHFNAGDKAMASAEAAATSGTWSGLYHGKNEATEQFAACVEKFRAGDAAQG